jgi:hypothetical protein
MKNAFVLSLELAALAAGAALEKRQGLAAIAAKMPGIVPKVIDAPAQVRPGQAKRQLIRLGPFTLPANKVRSITITVFAK